MAEIPKPPSVIVKVPTATVTQGTLPLPPSASVFPVASLPDQKGLLFARWTGSAWPARLTITTDPTRPVVWIGPSEPPIDGTYALNNIDLYWKTS